MKLFNNGKTAFENAADFVIECDENGIEGQDDDDMSHARWEAENLRNYFASVSMECEASLSGPADAPINSEYCSHHDGPGNGGWCCAICREEEAGIHQHTISDPTIVDALNYYTGETV